MITRRNSKLDLVSHETDLIQRLRISQIWVPRRRLDHFNLFSDLSLLLRKGLKKTNEMGKTILIPVDSRNFYFVETFFRDQFQNSKLPKVLKTRPRPVPRKCFFVLILTRLVSRLWILFKTYQKFYKNGNKTGSLGYRTLETEIRPEIFSNCFS